MRAPWEEDRTIRIEDLHTADPALVLRHLRLAPRVNGAATGSLGAEAAWEMAASCKSLPLVRCDTSIAIIQLFPPTCSTSADGHEPMSTHDAIPRGGPPH